MAGLWDALIKKKNSTQSCISLFKAAASGTAMSFFAQVENDWSSLHCSEPRKLKGATEGKKEKIHLQHKLYPKDKYVYLTLHGPLFIWDNFCFSLSVHLTFTDCGLKPARDRSWNMVKIFPNVLRDQNNRNLHQKKTQSYTHEYWLDSFLPISGQLIFWRSIRMMQMNRIKLICREYEDSTKGHLMLVITDIIIRKFFQYEIHKSKKKNVFKSASTVLLSMDMEERTSFHNRSLKLNFVLLCLDCGAVLWENGNFLDC